MTLRRKPRISCPHCGAVYVLEKEGEAEARAETETETPEPEFHPLPIRSHDWYAFFFRLRAKPEAAPVNVAPLGKPQALVNGDARRLLKNAKDGNGTRCPYADRPTEAERAALVKIPTESDALRAWQRTLADEGYPAFGDDGSVYLWAPSEFPPGYVHDPPESEDRERQNERMEGEGRT